MDELLVERSGNGVVTLTLNRPRVKNAISVSMWEELRRVLVDVTQREADRVVVITGAGGDFCAGADLSDDPMGIGIVNRVVPDDGLDAFAEKRAPVFRGR